MTYVKRGKGWRMSCGVGEATISLENEQSLFSNLSVTSSTSRLHFPTLPFLHLRNSSFSNPSFASPTSQALHLIHLVSSFSNLSVTSPTSQLILQPFPRFTYVTTHSPTFPSLYLCHSSFSNLSVALPTSQFILQPFFRFSYVTSSSLNSPGELILQHFPHFTYVTAHSPTIPSLYSRHSSFSNPSVALPTSQLILQPFRCFTYVTGFSLTSPGEPPML